MKVDHSSTGVTVHCTDGSHFAGDIVAGADGIHSTTRYEMWRHADNRGSSSMLANDKTGK